MITVDQRALRANDPARRERGPQPARAATDPGSAADLEPLPSPAHPLSLAALQRAAGNRAASRMIQREDPPAAPQTPSQQLDEAIKTAKADDDPGVLKKLERLPNPITPQQMFDLCDIILKQFWVGPFDEMFLERAWQNYGPASRITADDYRLWQRCEDAGAEARNVPWLAELRSTFAQKTRALANTNLDKNEKSIEDEGKRLGVSVDGKAAPPPTEETDKLIAEQRLAADSVKRAREALAKLREIEVGYAAPTWGKGTLPPGGTPESTGEKPQRVKFDPQAKPERAPFGDEVEPMPSWETVFAVHRDINTGITRLANANPAIYALITSGESDSLPGQDLASVRTKIGTSLQGVLENVRKTRAAIESQSLGWENMLPVHERLLATDPVYSSGFAKAAARAYIEDEGGNAEAANGIMTVAVMALILAVEIGSAGTATPLVAALIGLTASTATAASSWEEWSKLETAAKSTVSDETAVVSQGQADAALLAAMLDTAFALIDVYGVGKAGRAAKGAARVAGLEAAEGARNQLRNLAGLEAGERAAVLAKAIDQEGIAAVIQKSGHTAEQLIELAGRESPVGKRLAEFAAAGALSESVLKDLAPRIAGIGRLAREEAESVAKQGIESFGPNRVVQQSGGWPTLEKALGADSPSLKRLEAWRDGIVGEAEGYLSTRTGLAGAALDAASETAAAREFLSSRTGFAVDHLEDVLGIVIQVVGAAMNGGEGAEPEPEFATTAGVYEIALPPPRDTTTAPGPARMIQRAQPRTGGGAGAATTGLEGLSGGDFESIVDSALRQGTFPQLPSMEFVVPGHYNGSGWGIDRIGITGSREGSIRVYHFEMKYVSLGSPHPPMLGESKRLGTQTGLAWTENAIEALMNSQNEIATASRLRIRNALTAAHGEQFNNKLMREFLQEHLTHAPVAIITPSYARVGALWRQVFPMLETGRRVVIIQPLTEGRPRIRRGH